MFAAIERTIGDGSSVSVSCTDFRLDHHIARKAVSPSLKLLDHLGRIEIEPGPRLINVFRSVGAVLMRSGLRARRRWRAR